MIKIAINGFGRIGRLTFRQLLKKENVKVVAINDLTDTRTLSHLLKYDSVHGKLNEDVTHTTNSIKVGAHEIKVFSEKDPTKLPWGDLNIDVVLECTGIFRNKEKMSYHLQAGARKVLLSAPASDDIKTIVMGVNDDNLSPDDLLISNASCTTNCLAPMSKVLNDNFGIVRGFMTTTHAYTADQNLQDGPHSDLRRARAAALSIIPTSTGAAKAISLVIPELEGKLDGFAMRVPTPTGSVTDLTVELEKNATIEDINRLMKEAANGSLKGILEFSDAPLVSADIVGNQHSCILDSDLTNVNGKLVKIVGWYDNESGYSSRLADMAVRMGES
ncbi:type I glyceraldehyde-3-phosphate dehydrogenase [Owenweeksia hongkongensis]|uniref:type I glyceraldehyde-3-phosphate dehydrogenase n=1 Tax=Owenweeksia hongkongensis TaxID=253245 RepID=UPI003A929F50